MGWKNWEENFNVPMGCYDGAEVCELVGTYILNKLKNVTNKDNIGLYRDDGLGILQNIPKTEIEWKKKQIVKVFKDCGLSITTKCNLKSIDFLDVTFDLVAFSITRTATLNPVKFNISRTDTYLPVIKRSFLVE